MNLEDVGLLAFICYGSVRALQLHIFNEQQITVWIPESRGLHSMNCHFYV